MSSSSVSLSMLSVMATNRCNLRCKHCWWDNKHVHKPDVMDVNINLLSEILIGNRRRLDGHRVIDVFHGVGFSGGEACLHPDFDEMIKMVAEMGYYFSFVTNGTSPDVCEKLFCKYPTKFCSIDISLDGFESEHDYMRGKGTFKKTINTIKKMVAAKEPYVTIKMCVTKVNQGIIKPFVDFCDDHLKVDRLAIFHMMSNNNNKDIALTEEEDKKLHEKVLNWDKIWCDRKRMLIRYHNLLWGGDCEIIGYNDTQYHITPDNMITPCCKLPGIYGIENDGVDQAISDLRLKMMPRLREHIRQLDNKISDKDRCYECSKFFRRRLKKEDKVLVGR